MLIITINVLKICLALKVVASAYMLCNTDVFTYLELDAGSLHGGFVHFIEGLFKTYVDGESF